MRAEEGELVAFERASWRQRDWAPAIVSFLSRLLFLPLLRLRDRARTSGLPRRMLVTLLFYPSYAVAMVLWCGAAVLVLLASPLLFFLGRGLGVKRTA